MTDIPVVWEVEFTDEFERPWKLTSGIERNNHGEEIF